jgi:hypothetical protein
MIAEGDENKPADQEPAHEIGEAFKKPLKIDASEPIGSAGGYRLISDLTSSFVALVVGLAWPATVLLLGYLLVHNAAKVAGVISNFMKDKTTVEVAVGPRMGLQVKIVTAAVQTGLSQQVKSISGTGSTQSDQINLQAVAATAANQLVPQTRGQAKTLVKVLWVDDHPEYNIGLQYAFQALGMVVICIDSNVGIQDAFVTSGGFDVVITDMYRDAVGWKKKAQPEGGLETVSIIRDKYSKVPVVIYASRYATEHAKEHANDPLEPPVIAITNDTQKVFTIVTELAAKVVSSQAKAP